MKKITIMAGLTLVLFALNCSGGAAEDGRRNATSVGKKGWVFEGWACKPDSAQALQGLSPADYCKPDGPKDYLYLKFSAAASDVAIKSGRIAQMQSTCRKAAKDQISGDGLSKIIGEHLEQASGVADGQSTGQAIVVQNKGKISGIGVYDCCSLNADTGRCADPDAGDKETWEQCQCVGYFKFPGGEKAFEASAKEAQ